MDLKQICAKDKHADRKYELTSGVKRAAAKWCSHRGLWFPVIGLDNNLVALHQPLTDKLLKHLTCTHCWGFIFPPEKQSEE